MNFSQTIRAWRITAGLTQAELAVKIGYSQQTVNNWETRRVEPWPRKKDTILDQVRKATGCGRFSELEKGVMPFESNGPIRESNTKDKRHAMQPLSVTGAHQRKRTRPNVCEEITGKSSSNTGSQESVAQPKAIDFRRPPARG